MSREQRVFAHWKSFGPLKYVGNPGTEWEFHWQRRTPEEDNRIWLLLARVHKMKVREVKDIVTAERKRRKENAEVQESQRRNRSR
jgi:hypothetical protein